MERRCQLACYAGALLLLSVLAAGDTSPFAPGSKQYAERPFTTAADGCPMDTTMYFPLEAGTYTPILFLGGFYDWVNTGFYTDLLRNITAHGYIVFGIDRYNLPMSSRDAYEDLLVEAERNHRYGKANATILGQMEWLQKHVSKEGEAVVDWSRLTMGCHSASCDETLKIVQNYPEYAAASVFLDPMSFQSAIMPPINTTTAAMCYMSQKSFSFPTCCVKGMSYKRFYDVMQGPAVRMVVDNFGHCDVLDHLYWESCTDLHICPAGDESKLGGYKLFTAGMVNAFLRFTLYDDAAMKKYVTDQKYMPLPVEDLAYKPGSQH